MPNLNYNYNFNTVTISGNTYNLTGISSTDSFSINPTYTDSIYYYGNSSNNYGDYNNSWSTDCWLIKSWQEYTLKEKEEFLRELLKDEENRKIIAEAMTSPIRCGGLDYDNEPLKCNDAGDYFEAHNAGLISHKTLAEEFGLDYEKEYECQIGESEQNEENKGYFYKKSNNNNAESKKNKKIFDFSDIDN